MCNMGSVYGQFTAFSYFSALLFLAPCRRFSLCLPLTLFHLNRIAASLESVQIQARIFQGILFYPGGWNIQENAHIVEKGTIVEYSHGLETVLVLIDLFGCCFIFKDLFYIYLLYIFLKYFFKKT